MVNDYDGIREKFWYDFDDELFKFATKAGFHGQINELVFIQVMNQFMDYEEIHVFHDIYVVRPSEASSYRIRNELLDTFSLYCRHYPEYECLSLLEEFKRRHTFTCPQEDFQAFWSRVVNLLKQNEPNDDGARQ